MKKTWIVALLLALNPWPAQAARNSEALKQVESSMVVKGSIETNPDGSVHGITIDGVEKFPAGLVDYVTKEVTAWKFEPILAEGKPMRARSAMRLRVVAKKVDEENYSIGIRSASFDGPEPGEGETLTGKTMPPPRYPDMVAAAGASGVVYVVVKVDASGRVVDAIAEQVNLKTIGTNSEMLRWRNLLSASAINGARRWVFNVPVKGEQASWKSWAARVPVAFHMDKKLDTAYGKWEMYIPGDRQLVPWSGEDRPGFSPDALADGGIYMIGQSKGPKLLTVLDGT